MNTIWCIQQGSTAPIVDSRMSLSPSLSRSAKRAVSHFFAISLTCSLAFPFTLFPHIIPLHSYCLALIISCFSPSTSLCPPPPFPMLLSGLSDRLVMVSLILIQLYKSQTANKVTCCPLKDIHFYDL